MNILIVAVSILGCIGVDVSSNIRVIWYTLAISIGLFLGYYDMKILQDIRNKKCFVLGIFIQLIALMKLIIMNNLAQESVNLWYYSILLYVVLIGYFVYCFKEMIT